MTNWTAGYVADIGYTYGYYEELNPQRIKLALLKSGFVPPTIRTACELGFGQGLSANLHAAASDIEWYGTDFNPSQAAFAQELAIASGSGAKLYDDSFADFARRDDLPDFDYIGLHGIWSWISDENRSVIVEFIRRRLKVGGLLYVSYNTLPGWASFAPMRHLMTEHAEVIGSEGRGIVNRIGDALDFADRMLKTNPRFGAANPGMADRINQLKAMNRQYLAHEYFNRDWHPMHFSTMAEWLTPAKVTYACSASLLDHVDVINITPEQQAFLQDIPDAMFRESVRDFMVNQPFRRDYWIKGPRPLSPLVRAEKLRAERVMLANPRSKVTLKATGALGEASFSEKIYDPILDVLADYKPKTVEQIERAVAGLEGITSAHILEAIRVLNGNGTIMPVQDDVVAAKVRKQTERLNGAVMNIARGSSEIMYLASPVVGGGIPISRFHQLFLYAVTHGRKTPAEWVQVAWDILSAQGQRIIKDGVTLEGAEANIAELTERAEELVALLPTLKALGIV